MGTRDTSRAHRKPLSVASPTVSPPSCTASGSIVCAIIVSIEPAATAWIPFCTISNSPSWSSSGTMRAPTKAPMPVVNMVVAHMARILAPLKPEDFMSPDELSASGKLLKKTDTTRTSAFLPVPTMNPMTRDSGIASMKMPSQIITAVCRAAACFTPSKSETVCSLACSCRSLRAWRALSSSRLLPACKLDCSPGKAPFSMRKSATRWCARLGDPPPCMPPPCS
mmetsp:Transcript_12201/g.28615  ORF Transcript_12201/g.28615 Transcript_12201/m.28615 type:complete len:224 (+) Transcript_12201:289-960(+)